MIRLIKLTILWIACSCWFYDNGVCGFYLLNVKPLAVQERCGQVHLTVSASVETYLELNWITACDNTTDLKSVTISLYDNHFDGKETNRPVLSVNASDFPAGYYETTIKFEFPVLPGGWEYSEKEIKAESGPHCYPYWIVARNGSNVIDSRCLKIEPTWMNDHWDHLEGRNLADVLIPGTHDAGAFEGVTGIVGNYTLTQDRSIWSQLVHGMRFLDLRIAYYENEGFFINHGLIKLMRVEPVLKQIRRYVDLAPREIVILDIHQFPFPSDFNASLHDQFIKILDEHVGDVTVSKSKNGLRIKDIWDSNKNFVVTYANAAKVKEYDWLWPSLRQYWADTTIVDNLKNYIDDTLRTHIYTDDTLYAMMAELTPQVEDILLLKNNLRKLANDVNRFVTKWFRDEWANKTNIVAVDYFLGNDIIDVAIQANINKRV